jgi:SAM-dependent methyltransferase
MRVALLEPFLRSQRIQRILPYVRRYPDCELLDVGCGMEARLLKAIEPYIARGVGIDQRVAPLSAGKLTTVPLALCERLPFPDRHFDVVTMLAVLEHLSEPEAILHDIARVLRPGGALLVTVPTWHAKPLLEFLAFRLRVVDEREIRDHRRYFGRRDLRALLARVPGLTLREHRYFQLAFNNFLYATRDAA